MHAGGALYCCCHYCLAVKPSLKLRRGARATACAVVGLLAALLAVSVDVEPSQAAVRALAGNLGQSPAGGQVLRSDDLAQGFRTGSLGSGYRLDSIDVWIVAVSGGSPTLSATLHKDDPLSAAVAALTSPSSVSNGSAGRFSAPSGTVLEPSATYYLVLEQLDSDSIVVVGVTDSDSEDAAEVGWEVLDVSGARAYDDTGAFSDEDQAAMIRVNGELMADTLVANTGQAAGSSESLELYDVAQGFDTGSDAPGFQIDGIDVLIGAIGTAGSPTMTLHADDPASSAVATLQGPDAVVVGVNSFVAPNGIVLDPATAYFVVVEGSDHSVSLISSDREDSRRSGWSVHDGRRRRDASSTAVFESELAESLGIAIRGVAVPAADLAGLELTGAGGDPIAWNQGRFNTATTVYTAAAAMDASPVTVTAAPAPGTTAMITGPGGSTATGSGEFDLSEGFNEFTVVAAGAYNSKTYQAFVEWSPEQDLVTNTAEAQVSADSIGGAVLGSYVQPFTTGPAAGGYLLVSVGVFVAGEDLEAGEEVEAFVYESTGGSGLGRLVAQLTAPASYAAGAVNTFAAPAATTLKPGTDYRVVLTVDADAPDDFEVSVTASPTQSGRSGWTIDDRVLIDGSTADSDGALRMAVRGAPIHDGKIPSPEVSFSEEEYNTDEDRGVLRLTVVLSEPSPLDVVVDIEVGSHPDFTGRRQPTLGRNGDYELSGGGSQLRLPFRAGATSAGFDVSILNDGAVEGDEVFAATITDVSWPGTLGKPARTAVTIIDDDAVNVRMEHANYQTTEGTTSCVEIAMVMRSPDPNNTGPIDDEVRVEWEWVEGTAEPNLDFVDVAGEMVFLPRTIRSLPQRICIIDDDLAEALRQTFSVRPKNTNTDTRVRVNVIPSTVTIGDDEARPMLSVGPATAVEGDDLVFAVSLNAKIGNEVSFSYSVTDGSALAGSDYVAPLGSSVTIPARLQSAQIRVGTVPDGITEGAETLTLMLSDPSGPDVVPDLDVASAQGTITDGPSPGVAVAPQALEVREGQSGHYQVRLGAAPAAGATVTVTPRPLGVSVMPTSLTFTDADWSDPQTVTVTAPSDSDRRDESAVVDHDVTGGGYTSAPTVQVTVIDDDRVNPGAPRSLSAVVSAESASLRWAAPASEGGHTLVDYQYLVVGRGTTSAGTRPRAPRPPPR